MITQFFLSFFPNFIGYFFKFLPTGDPVIISNITEAVASVQTALNTASWILPANFYFCLSSVFYLLWTLFFFRFIRWVLRNVSLGIVK